MVWFKVDDKFHGSVEVMSIPLRHRAAAVGLWTLAGAWSSDHLKDGYVPATHLENWGGTIELADVLVDAKLWTRKRDGYQFRNWAKWQRTRAQVEDDREAVRKRVADHRAKKTGNPTDNNGGVTRYKPGETPPQSSPDPTRPDQQDQDLNRSGHSGNRETDGQSYTQVESAVEKPGQFQQLVEHIIELAHTRCGRTIDAHGVVALIEYTQQRRGKSAGQPLKAPFAYYTSTITKHWPEYQAFIDEKGFAL